MLNPLTDFGDNNSYNLSDNGSLRTNELNKSAGSRRNSVPTGENSEANRLQSAETGHDSIHPGALPVLARTGADLHVDLPAAPTDPAAASSLDQAPIAGASVAQSPTSLDPPPGSLPRDQQEAAAPVSEHGGQHRQLLTDSAGDHANRMWCGHHTGILYNTYDYYLGCCYYSVSSSKTHYTAIEQHSQAKGIHRWYYMLWSISCYF